MKLLKRMWTRIKPILVDLELPILVFPVLVVMIVATTFLFPAGRCGAWQWWLAVAFTSALCFYKAKDWRRGFAVSGSFILALGCLWMTTKITITSGWDDTLRYHQPAIRMMIDGWNPVWQGTFEGIEKSVGISPDWMNAYHVISMPRGVWYFCASAFFFTKATYNLLFPLFPILFISVTYVVCRVFKNLGWVYKSAIALLILGLIPSHGSIVDTTVALGAIGLLLSMYYYLKNGRWSWLYLIIFTFWMAISKQTALLHCCVFWTVFVAINILRKDWKSLRNVSVVGCIAFSLFAVASVSPYFSAYKNFGHPLYPRYSGNEEKYPPKNITADFFVRNEDAAAMGHLGAYINAFVSRNLAHKYYKIKLDKPDFLPISQTWWQSNRNHATEGTPTYLHYRIEFCLALVILLVWGSLGARFVALAVVAGTLAMPTEMIGYTRYTPWALFVCALCIPVAVESRRLLAVKYAVFGMALLMLIPSVSKELLDAAIFVDNSYALRRILSKEPPKVLLADYKGDFGASETHLLANLILAKKHNPRLANTAILAYPFDGVDLSDTQRYKPFFNHSCKVMEDCDLLKFSAHRRLLEIPDRKKRLLSYPLFVGKTFFVTLPKSIWEVVNG